jgi:hypothetical protein
MTDGTDKETVVQYVCVCVCATVPERASELVQLHDVVAVTIAKMVNCTLEQDNRQQLHQWHVI